MTDARRLNPLMLVAVLLAASVAYGWMRGRAPSAAAACDGDELACEAGGPTTSGAASPGSSGSASSEARTFAASQVCNNVGYLCAELTTTDRIRLRRWRDPEGTLVVHIPRPEFEDAGDALALQQAASLGVRAWNGQPFQILVDLQGDRNAHFAVRWLRGLGGNQIGVARTQWSSAEGLSVVSIDLATRRPEGSSPVADPRQVRLTAAHEMGHALGLPHSDAPRDVMYPTNTATALSPRDYRTMESLYALPDGAEIVRD